MPPKQDKVSNKTKQQHDKNNELMRLPKDAHSLKKKQDLPSILLFLAVACFLPLLSLLPLSTCWVDRVE